MASMCIPLLELSFTASGVVPEKRFIDASGARATAQGQRCIGVSSYGAADGADFAAVVKGTAVVETGAAISKGDRVISDAQGRAIPASALAVAAGAVAMTSSAANGDVLEGGTLPDSVQGDALEAATGAGEFIEILLV